MKEFITDLLTKVNNSLDTKINIAQYPSFNFSFQLDRAHIVAAKNSSNSNLIHTSDLDYNISKSIDGRKNSNPSIRHETNNTFTISEWNGSDYITSAATLDSFTNNIISYNSNNSTFTFKPGLYYMHYVGEYNMISGWTYITIRFRDINKELQLEEPLYTVADMIDYYGYYPSGSINNFQGHTQSDSQLVFITNPTNQCEFDYFLFQADTIDQYAVFNMSFRLQPLFLL